MTQVVTFDTVSVDRVKSTLGEGGLLFSAPTVTNLNLVFNLAVVTGVNAKLLGSIVSLRKGMIIPALTVTTTNSQFSCQIVDLELQRVAILANFDLPTPIADIGGAFYFEGV
jgi:hypothetical protein